MKQIQIQYFLCEVSEFFEAFPSLEEWKHSTALSSRTFEGPLEFHVRREPQNDPKIVEKSVGRCLAI